MISVPDGWVPWVALAVFAYLLVVTVVALRTPGQTALAVRLGNWFSVSVRRGEAPPPSPGEDD